MQRPQECWQNEVVSCSSATCRFSSSRQRSHRCLEPSCQTLQRESTFRRCCTPCRWYFAGQFSQCCPVQWLQSCLIANVFSVLVPFRSLPRFWIWMYRLTPVTYFVRTMVSTGIAGISITCAANELLYLNPPTGQSCSSYLSPYMTYSPGQLMNPDATSGCQVCPMRDVDTLLAQVGAQSSQRWRDFGMSLIYTVVNMFGAMMLYWAFRVPRRGSTKKEK